MVQPLQGKDTMSGFLVIYFFIERKSFAFYSMKKNNIDLDQAKDSIKQISPW